MLTSYNIYSGNTLVGTVIPQILQYTLSVGIVAGQSYQITVSAVSVIGEGPRSNPIIIWAIDVPSSSVLTLTDTSRDTCSVSWTPVSPPANSLITGY
jgi:hypothetical protein